MAHHMFRIRVIIHVPQAIMCRARTVIIPDRIPATVEIHVIGAIKCPMFLTNVSALCRVTMGVVVEQAQPVQPVLQVRRVL